MFIAMNRFQVNPERSADFEDIWKTRESHLQSVPGFLQFCLLKGDLPGEYISHSTWESRDAFTAWARSDAFRRAHADGTPDGIVVGHPKVSLYETVLEESAVRV